MDKKLVFVWVIFSILQYSIEAASIPGNDNSFMDSLSTGFKFAGKLLGMDQSSSVANLVAQAFAGPTRTTSASKNTNKQSQNYQFEDSEYSSNDISTDKSDSNTPQFPNIVNGGVLFGSSGNDGSSGPELQSPMTTTSTAAPTATFGGIASVLRVLGMDEKKLSALLVNGLIFIAQMVKKSASYIDQKLSPLKTAFRRLLIKFPGDNTNVVFVKEH